MATDPWTRACNKFMDDLTEEERRLFTGASPQNLLVGAQLAYEEYDSNSKLRAAEKTLAPLVAVISEYGSALDVFSNTYSLILSPLWGSIRVVLQIAENTTQYFEKLVTMFGRIGDVLPRFNIYERLFSDHERLLETLSVAYLDIISFCQDAKSTFRNRGLFFKGVHWQPFKQRFQKTLDSLREHVKNVDKEAGLAHMIEAASSRELTLANKAIEESRWKEHRRIQLLARLSNVPYAEMHRKAQDLRCPETCGWILNETLYQAWHQSQSSTVLCIYGPPGFGKTILVSSLIDSLKPNIMNDATAIAYYYCDYSDSQSLLIGSVIGTLIKQLLMRLPSIPLAIEQHINRAFNYGLQTPSEQNFADLLHSTIGIFDEVFVVIDGLDTCELIAQQSIIDLIKRLVGSDNAIVRILVASRDDLNISIPVENFTSMKLSETTVASDIGAYVKHAVALKVAKNELVFHDLKVKDKVESSLVNGACGMFLWVYFQVEELCGASSDYEVLGALKQLPIGLTETYARILKRISSMPRKSLIACKALRWIVCAKRPLKIKELAEAVAFSTKDQQWDSSKIPDVRQILRFCGNLVTFDEQDQTVRLVHHTVRQHLLSDHSEDALKHFHFDEVEGDIYAGEICITYLLFSDFETQIVRRPPELDITRIQEALISEMPHTLDLGTLIFGAWKTFRKFKSSTSGPNINVSALLLNRNPPSITLHEKYIFLDYAISHWTSHTVNFIPELELWHKFKYIALEKHSNFDIRPWGSSQLASGLPHMLLFRWAVYNGHMALLTALSSTTYSGIISYYQYETDQGRSPLLTAVESGQSQLVQLLGDYDDLLRHHNLHKIRPLLSMQETNYARRLLLASAAQHNVEVAQWVANKLLKSVSEDLATEATCLAMSNTSEEMGNFYSTYILHFYHVRDRVLHINEHNFGPLLDVSCQNGQVDVVRFLLQEAEAEELEMELPVPTFDNYKRYRAACDNGRLDIFRVLAEYSLPDKLLLPRGITVDESNFGWLLDISIERGHFDMVQFLLQEAEAEKLKHKLISQTFSSRSWTYQVACSEDRLAIFRVLTEYSLLETLILPRGVIISEKTLDWFLDISIQQGRIDMVESFLEKAEAEEFVTFTISSRRYQEACSKNRPDIFRTLAEFSLPEIPILPQGISINEENFGWYLDISIELGRIDIVELLLQESKVEVLTTYNETYIMFDHSPRFLRACRRNHLGILFTLASYFIGGIPFTISSYTSCQHFIDVNFDLLSAGFKGTDIPSALRNLDYCVVERDNIVPSPHYTPLRSGKIEEESI